MRPYTLSPGKRKALQLFNVMVAKKLTSGELTTVRGVKVAVRAWRDRVLDLKPSDCNVTSAVLAAAVAPLGDAAPAEARVEEPNEPPVPPAAVHDEVLAGDSHRILAPISDELLAHRVLPPADDDIIAPVHNGVLAPGLDPVNNHELTPIHDQMLAVQQEVQ